MEYRIVVEQRARRDVDETVAFIADKVPDAAFQWYEDIYDSFASLASMPKRCRVVREPELAEFGTRQLLQGVYRVLFTVNEELRTVHIHHVRHGMRRSATPEDVARDDD